MSEIQYEIVFYGSLAAGFTQEQTQEYVAQLFKTSVDQVERMFSGNRVVIRNKLDQATALKYIVAMQKRGAECQIEAMGQPGKKVEFSNASAAIETPTAPASIATNTTTPTATKSRVLNQDGLPVAGEKVDEILAATHFDLAPVGEILSDHHLDEEQIVTLPNLDGLSLAPAGSDLVDKKPDIPVPAPDISHLKIEPQ